jgi:putative oxidoreductase
MIRLARHSERALLLLRVVAGLLFACHGAQKLFGLFGGMGGKGGAASLGTLPWFAGGIEITTGALLILGLMTRPAAFLASGTMAVAYFMAHASQGFWPIQNHGELAVLYCFLFFYLFFRGPGRYSLDYLWRRPSVLTGEAAL